MWKEDGKKNSLESESQGSALIKKKKKNMFVNLKLNYFLFVLFYCESVKKKIQKINIIWVYRAVLC